MAKDQGLQGPNLMYTSGIIIFTLWRIFHLQIWDSYSSYQCTDQFWSQTKWVNKILKNTYLDQRT